MARILLVDDEVELADSLAQHLRREGHSVDVAYEGNSAWELLQKPPAPPYDLLVLDWMLPGLSGLSLCQQVRQVDRATPILFLTAKDTLDDRVEGLDAGADDYLVKPFDLDELLARVRALARRAAGRAEPVLAHGRLRLDPATHSASLGGRPLQLSPREFALLQLLLEKPGAVLSRAQLEERLYGWNEPVGSNAVEVHIHHLRRKLGERAIRNVRGVGWTLGDVDAAA